MRKPRALISVPDFFNNELLGRLVVNLKHSCSLSEHEGSQLLEEHHIIQLGCFVIDLTYSAENAA